MWILHLIVTTEYLKQKQHTKYEHFSMILLVILLVLPGAASGSRLIVSLLDLRTMLQEPHKTCNGFASIAKKNPNYKAPRNSHTCEFQPDMNDVCANNYCSPDIVLNWSEYTSWQCVISERSICDGSSQVLAPIVMVVPRY